MPMSDMEVLERLRFCPICTGPLKSPNSVYRECVHGYFVIPFDNAGAPIEWVFKHNRKNEEDDFIMARLNVCPFCNDSLTYNSMWNVKNCPNLHGDIRVKNGKVTFDFDEPDYEIVRTDAN